MSEPEVDPEKLEEARLTKTLSGVRNRGHNAFTATQAPHKKKASSPEKQEAAAASPPQYGRAPMTHKAAASGPMPEWKRQQMERDEGAQKKREEEERRRQQYVSQITTGVAAGQSSVETTSAVTSNFVDPLAAKSNPRLQEVEAAPQPTAAQTFFDPADKEEELKREEEYMARRTGLSPQRTTSTKVHVNTKVGTSGVAEKDAHLALGSKTQKLGVLLVDAASGVTLDEGAFMLKNGRLPVLAVENGLKVRDLVWKENGVAIKAEADGYSAASFGGRDFIEVTGHRVISG